MTSSTRWREPLRPLGVLALSGLSSTVRVTEPAGIGLSAARAVQFPHSCRLAPPLAHRRAGLVRKCPAVHGPLMAPGWLEHDGPGSEGLTSVQAVVGATAVSLVALGRRHERFFRQNR